MVFDTVVESYMEPIILSTLWLLVVTVCDVIITLRLTEHVFLRRKAFLLGLVVGLVWLITLASWMLTSLWLVPSDERPAMLMLSGFVALSASCVFALAAAIAAAVRQNQ
jgi:hypothetical protein